MPKARRSSNNANCDNRARPSRPAPPRLRSDCPRPDQSFRRDAEPPSSESPGHDRPHRPQRSGHREANYQGKRSSSRPDRSFSPSRQHPEQPRPSHSHSPDRSPPPPRVKLAHSAPVRHSDSVHQVLAKPGAWENSEPQPDPEDRGSETVVSPMANPAQKTQSDKLLIPPLETETDTDLIYGRHAVLTALATERTFNRIWVTAHLRHDPRFLTLLEKAKINGAVIDVVSPQRLEYLTNQGRHQGIAAQVAAYAYLELGELIDQAQAKSHHPLLIAAEGVNDPQNLGAIIRSAEAFGAQGMIIPQRRAVGVTAAVAKVAAGALDYLPMARVTNMNQALEALKESGFWLYGLSVTASQTLAETKLSGPVALVIGAEGSGLSLQAQKHCDHLVSIPLAGQTESLNAAVAAGIALYEVARQRQVPRKIIT